MLPDIATLIAGPHGPHVAHLDIYQWSTYGVNTSMEKTHPCSICTLSYSILHICSYIKHHKTMCVMQAVPESTHQIKGEHRSASWFLHPDRSWQGPDRSEAEQISAANLPQWPMQLPNVTKQGRDGQSVRKCHMSEQMHTNAALQPCGVVALSIC